MTLNMVKEKHVMKQEISIPDNTKMGKDLAQVFTTGLTEKHTTASGLMMR